MKYCLETSLAWVDRGIKQGEKESGSIEESKMKVMKGQKLMFLSPLPAYDASEEDGQLFTLGYN